MPYRKKLCWHLILEYTSKDFRRKYRNIQMLLEQPIKMLISLRGSIFFALLFFFIFFLKKHLDYLLKSIIISFEKKMKQAICSSFGRNMAVCGKLFTSPPFRGVVMLALVNLSRPTLNKSSFQISDTLQILVVCC